MSEPTDDTRAEAEGTGTTRSRPAEARPELRPIPAPDEKKSWWPAIAGMVTCLAIAGVLLLWWSSRSTDETDVATGVAQAAEDEPAGGIDAAEPVIAAEEEAEEAPPVQAIPTPEPPAPEIKPTANTSSGTASSGSHTNCSYADGSWPMVGSKYVVRCDEGTFLATQGAYKGGGVYEFKDFEAHNN